MLVLLNKNVTVASITTGRYSKKKQNMENKI